MQEYSCKHKYAHRHKYACNNIKAKSSADTMALSCPPLRGGFIGLYVACRSIPLVKKSIVWAPLQLWLSVRATAPPLLSYPPTIIRALGATWSLAGWLGSLQSAGCERGHPSRALQVSGERAERGEGLFEERQRRGFKLHSARFFL